MLQSFNGRNPSSVMLVRPPRTKYDHLRTVMPQAVCWCVSVVLIFGIFVVTLFMMNGLSADCNRVRAEIDRLEHQIKENKKILQNHRVTLSRLEDGKYITVAARKLGLHPSGSQQAVRNVHVTINRNAEMQSKYRYETSSGGVYDNDWRVAKK